MFDRYVVTPVIALGLAFLIWVYVRSRDQEVQVYSLPVSVSLDPQQADRFDFETKPEMKMRVKFFGLPSRLRQVKERVDQDDLVLRKVVHVPAAADQRLDNEYRETLQFDAAELIASLPLGVHAEITPAEGRVPVILKRVVEKTMVLQPNVTPSSSQYELEGPVRLEPASIRVTGPKSLLDQVSQLVLEPWQPTLPGSFDPTSENAVELSGRLRVPAKINNQAVKVSPDTVEVRVKVKPALRVYELADIPIFFLCPPDFPYRPQFASESHATLPKLRIRGPASRSLDSRDIRAYIDLPALAAKQNLKHGTYPDEPITFDLPNGFYLAQDPPRLSNFKLMQLESTPLKPSPGNGQ